MMMYFLRAKDGGVEGAGESCQLKIRLMDNEIQYLMDIIFKIKECSNLLFQAGAGTIEFVD